MVNKRSTKCGREVALADMNTFLTIENQSLKRKNEELAKALSDAKMEQQKLHQGSLILQERIYALEFERVKCQEFIKSIGDATETHIQKFINLINDMTNTTLKKAKIFSNSDAIKKMMNVSTSSEDLNVSPSKTMAVMPMVDGHTILSPKINLPRITVKQLTHMMNNEQASVNVGENDNESDEIEFANDVSMNNEADFESSSSVTNETSVRRLDTMPEEDEENLSTTRPLLSGVFKDVKVYISPVIQFKSKTSQRSNLRNLSRCMNASSMEHSSYNAAEDANTTQRIDQTQSSMSGTRDEFTSMQIENTGSSVCNTNNKKSIENDPMEGPSNLLNVLDSEEAFFNAPNQTSTPRLINKSISSDSEEFDTPVSQNTNITVRKRRTSASSSRMSNCTVRLQKMSSNELKSYSTSSISSTNELRSYSTTSNSSTNKPRETTTRNRPDSPTLLETSRSGLSTTDISYSTRGRHSKRLRKTSSESSCSLSSRRRPTRTATPITYKEPSSKKKLRRS